MGDRHSRSTSMTYRFLVGQDTASVLFCTEEGGTTLIRLSSVFGKPNETTKEWLCSEAKTWYVVCIQ